MDAGFFISKIFHYLKRESITIFFYEKEEKICRVCVVIHKLCEFLQSLFCQAFLFFFLIGGDSLIISKLRAKK